MFLALYVEIEILDKKKTRMSQSEERRAIRRGNIGHFFHLYLVIEVKWVEEMRKTNGKGGRETYKPCQMQLHNSNSNTTSEFYFILFTGLLISDM